MLRIVTDGSADMPEIWLKEFDIQVIPLTVRFGEEVYTQGKDIDQSRFYDLVREKKIIPHSSLPSIEQIKSFFRKNTSRNDQVLSIHVGSKLSGTYAMVEKAAEELGGERQIYPFDSGAGSAALGFLCREARKDDRAGWSIDKICKKMDEIKQKMTVIFTVDNLEFARMSGRINAIQTIISSILKIKPIIILRDGLLQIAEKVRTRQYALDRILQIAAAKIGYRKADIAVVHAADPATAKDLSNRIKALIECVSLFISELSIPVAANLGPGTVGIVAIPVDA
jgi:DegV family protein with EDD domain